MDDEALDPGTQDDHLAHGLFKKTDGCYWEALSHLPGVFYIPRAHNTTESGEKALMVQ
jgi:hypothetical protein